MNLNLIKANMTELEVNGMKILFSYKTPVAIWVGGLAYKTNKRWSNTTTRHINSWQSVYDFSKPQEFFDNLVSDTCHDKCIAKGDNDHSHFYKVK